MVISRIFESIAISEHSFRLFKVNSNFISLSGHCGTDRNELNMTNTITLITFLTFASWPDKTLFLHQKKKVIIKVDSIFVVVTEHILWLFRFVHGCCLFVIINESSGALKMNFVQRIIHQIKDCLVQLVNG